MSPASFRLIIAWRDADADAPGFPPPEPPLTLPAQPEQSIIHLVDDDESVRRALSRLLRSAGFACVTFDSGEALLADLSPEVRGCLIMDIRMPGLTGLDIQRRLSDLDSQLSVIALSAQDDDETRQRARELGAVAFFRKPVDDQALLDAIRWTLDEQICPPPDPLRRTTGSNS